MGGQRSCGVISNHMNNRGTLAEIVSRQPTDLKNTSDIVRRYTRHDRDESFISFASADFTGFKLTLCPG